METFGEIDRPEVREQQWRENAAINKRLDDIFMGKLKGEVKVDTTFDLTPGYLKPPSLWQKFKAWKIWHIRLVDIRDYHHEGDCDY